MFEIRTKQDYFEAGWSLKKELSASNQFSQFF